MTRVRGFPIFQREEEMYCHDPVNHTNFGGCQLPCQGCQEECDPAFIWEGPSMTPPFANVVVFVEEE